MSDQRYKTVKVGLDRYTVVDTCQEMRAISGLFKSEENAEFLARYMNDIPDILRDAKKQREGEGGRQETDDQRNAYQTAHQMDMFVYAPSGNWVFGLVTFPPDAVAGQIACHECSGTGWWGYGPVEELNGPCVVCKGTGRVWVGLQ